MSIVTITRGSYSRGKEVAERLAKRMGYECLARDILLEASEEYSIPEIKLIRALHDAPKVLERFFGGSERYVKYYRSTLLQHARRDNIVYHGLAGHFFLKDIPHVLKIRINADINTRVKEEMAREKISAEEALYVLKKDDEERRKWGIQVDGMDPWDSRLYDLVINICTLSLEDAVDLIYGLLQKPTFRTSPESQKMVDDLAQTAKEQLEQSNR
jgi:cytidylate kinase